MPRVRTRDGAGVSRWLQGIISVS
ncbi:hypothetical protein Taro_015080 [Colocasia esculenta]|uniref:Uncharacterized protein n=1 Tax=Colocasia esculenta TaxID=4460 RepID=A0A843UGL6_COLES|nr:hypothetical protein [Colocasia esculenta]